MSIAAACTTDHCKSQAGNLVTQTCRSALSHACLLGKQDTPQLQRTHVRVKTSPHTWVRRPAQPHAAPSARTVTKNPNHPAPQSPHVPRSPCLPRWYAADTQGMPRTPTAKQCATHAAARKQCHEWRCSPPHDASTLPLRKTMNGDRPIKQRLSRIHPHAAATNAHAQHST